MSNLELSRQFVDVIAERHQRNPKLRLETDLKQINVALTSYAESLGTMPGKLPILYVCADSQHLHPHFIKHIESQPGDEKYKGQHISRLKKLIRNLPWSEELKGAGSPNPITLKEHLPPHLREVWFLLPRTHDDPCGNNSLHYRRVTEDECKKYRETIPLSHRSLTLGSALLKVSSARNITDIRVLLEKSVNLIHQAIREDNPRAKWRSGYTALQQFRKRVRAYLKYEVEEEVVITLRLEELKEPLQSQVRTYMERARQGFQTNKEIPKLARQKYGLKLKRHAEETIDNNVRTLRLALGYISHEKSAEVTDIRELLRLETKEVEVDGIVIPQFYNPLVEWYRNRGLNLITERKEEDFDASTFRNFIGGVAAIAAFNGHLHLRQLFLKEYKPKLDEDSKNRRKEIKKESFDQPWLDRQLQRLKAEFHNIVDRGSFKNKPDGGLSREARRDLNLCLFYVALLVLRFLGVRQGSLRDCKLGEHVIFTSYKCITFQWDKTKNGKGIRHRLDGKKHDGTHKELIDAVWTYYKKIYPYISGTSSDDQTPAIRKKRRQRVAGQFILRCGVDGLCSAFTHKSSFYNWFTGQANLFLELDGKPINIVFNPHFLRAMFGDWLRFTLKFSKEQTADIAADSEEVFEADYITHPHIFDATDLWTSKNTEIKAAKGRGEESLTDAQLVKFYKQKVADMEQTVNTMAETINKLSEKAS